MATPTRRGMDWPTAWSAIVPVYGLAVLLDAVSALFALPIWIIFFIYARKVLDGARAAEDPWRGRTSPRRYFLPFVAGLVVQDLGFAGLSPSAGSDVASAVLGTIVALASASIFVAASAPPGVRDERWRLRMGVGAEVAGTLVVPVAILTPISSGEAAVTAVSIARLGFASVSIAAFLLASRAASRHAPVVARKAPRS